VLVGLDSECVRCRGDCFSCSFGLCELFFMKFFQSWTFLALCFVWVVVLCVPVFRSQSSTVYGCADSSPKFVLCW
jgi:hypothetical protein